MSDKLQIKIDGLTITAEEEPYIVMMNTIEPGEDLRQLRIRVSEDVKSYDRMYYTTDLKAVNFILKKLTLRSSSLIASKLNDQAEKDRVGVEQFAGGRFITCFSHIDHEIASFWGLYGGDVPHEKVLLKFKNFACNFSDLFHTDYCFLGDGSKLFFYSDEYRRTLKHNCEAGQMAGLMQINTDYDIRNCIRSIEIFDVEYLPVKNEVFSQDYSGEARINWGNISENPQMVSKLKMYTPEYLGKQKSNPWYYEGESRILSCLDIQEFDEWAFIDLRLKEEIFRDLVVVMGPWAKPSLEAEIRGLLSASPINEEIKDSIVIVHSDLEGTLNF